MEQNTGSEWEIELCKRLESLSLDVFQVVGLLDRMRQVEKESEARGMEKAVNYISSHCPLLDAKEHDGRLYIGVIEAMPEDESFQVLPNTVLEAARTGEEVKK